MKNSGEFKTLVLSANSIGPNKRYYTDTEPQKYIFFYFNHSWLIFFPLQGKRDTGHAENNEKEIAKFQ